MSFFKQLFSAGAVSCLFVAAGSAAPVYTFVSLAGPTSNSYFRGIDNAGEVTGGYADFSTSPFTSSEFIRNVDGGHTIFSVSAPGHSAVAASINNAGAVTGYGSLAPGSEGYVRAADGTITYVGNPTPGANLRSMGTNVSGYSVGNYIYPNEGVRGYFTDAAGFHSFAAGTFQPNAINDLGQITGDNGLTSFLQNADGTSVTFTSADGNGLSPKSINNLGVVAGIHFDSVNKQHGFIRATDGTIQYLDVSIDGVVADTTSIYGINDWGVISGQYQTNTGTVYGFIGTPDTLNESATPEPGTWTMLAGAGFLFAFVANRRRTR
jgi:hypothetical protein